MKRRVVNWVQRHLANPIARRTARFLPGAAVIETIGRTSGLARPTPVGGALDGSTFWIVTEHGRQANYVRNLEVQPRVRVQIKGRWHAGTAQLLPEDDARKRLKQLPTANSLVVRLLGTDLMTLRVDLDPADARR